MHEKRLRHAMKLGGHNDVFTYRNPWPQAARELAVDPETLIDRVRGLAARAPDAIADAAAAPDVADLKRDLSRLLVDLVCERVGRCAALLDSVDG
jgi:hypothetical protein